MESTPKLSCLGISGQLLHWIRSFLSGRFQRVVINGSCSDWLPVQSGVPQGTVLAIDPLLFLLYVDDLRDVVSNATLKLFADDVALYCEVISTADCSLLQEDLNNICSWATKWQLRLNAFKCEVLFYNKCKLLTFKYSINDTPLSWHPSVNYLTICLQSHVSWFNHCKMISARAKHLLNFLRHSLWGTTVPLLQGQWLTNIWYDLC